MCEHTRHDIKWVNFHVHWPKLRESVCAPCGQMMLYCGGIATAWIKRQTINENSLNKLPYTCECVVRAPLFILAFGIRHFLCSLMWNCIFISKEMRRSKYSLRRKCIILTALIHTSTQRYYFHVCIVSTRWQTYPSQSADERYVKGAAPCAYT